MKHLEAKFILVITSLILSFSFFGCCIFLPCFEEVIPPLSQEESQQAQQISPAYSTINQVGIKFDEGHTYFRLNFLEDIDQQKLSHSQIVLAVDTSFDGISDFFIYVPRDSKKIVVVDNYFHILHEYYSEDEPSLNELKITFPYDLSSHQFDIIAISEFDETGEQTEQTQSKQVRIMPTSNYRIGQYSPPSEQCGQSGQTVIADVQLAQQQEQSRQGYGQQLLQGRKLVTCPPPEFRCHPISQYQPIEQKLPGATNLKGKLYDNYPQATKRTRGYQFWCSSWSNYSKWAFFSWVFSEIDSGYIGRCPFEQGQNNLRFVEGNNRGGTYLLKVLHSIFDGGKDDDNSDSLNLRDKMNYEYNYNDNTLTLTRECYDPYTHKLIHADRIDDDHPYHDPIKVPMPKQVKSR